MSNTIEWNAIGEKTFELGVDRGVLYAPSSDGVPWNGLINVTQLVSGAEIRSTYIDGIKINNDVAPQEFEATIQALTYPEEFERCDGMRIDDNGIIYDNQKRDPFGLSYRTLIGNDVDGPGHGYKLHLVYNALATPTQSVFATMALQSAPTAFSWNISTIPVHIPGYAPTAHIILDSTKISPALLIQIEDILYGGEEAPRLITPTELQAFLIGGMPYPATNLYPTVGIFPDTP